MTREEEYQLSLYQDMGAFNEKERVHLLRHRLSGKICVRKRVSASLLRIYRFLEKTKNPYIPEIYACIPDGDELIIIEEYIEGRTLADIIRERKEEISFAENGEYTVQNKAAGQMHFAGETAEGNFAGKAAERIFAGKGSAQEILSEELTAQIGVSLCRALRPLHNAEPMIICRDIKAENIIIENSSSSDLAQSVSRSRNEALWPERGAEAAHAQNSLSDVNETRRSENETAAAGRTPSGYKSTNEALWPEREAEAERAQGSFQSTNEALWPEEGNFSLKIVDFNISRQVKAGQTKDTQFMGTAQYAAPEQYGFLQTDNRTDIFSIGVLMNYCRTGEFPPDQTVDGALGEVICKCTALDPADRYVRAEDLENSLLPFCGSFRDKESLLTDPLRSGAQSGFRDRADGKAPAGPTECSASEKLSGPTERSASGMSSGPADHAAAEMPFAPANHLAAGMPFVSTDLSGSEIPSGPVNRQELQAPNQKRPREDSFWIPGFRSRRPRNMLIACVGYLLITAMSFSVDPSTDTVPLPGTWIRAEQFVYWCVNILFVFLVCNYRGLWNKLHLPAKKDGKPRLWACILVYVVLFFLWTFLCAALENAFLQVSV